MTSIIAEMRQPPVVGISDAIPPSAEYEAAPGDSSPIQAAQDKTAIQCHGLDDCPSGDHQAEEIGAINSKTSIMPPWPGAKAFHASRDAAKASPPIGAKERTPAHVRAIMAYLKLRAKRACAEYYLEAWHKMSELRCEALNDVTDLRRRLKTVQADLIRWQEQEIAREKADYAKRRRAVMTARDFQKRLYAEFDRVDHVNEKHWKARGVMAAKIKEFEAQIAATPVRRLMSRSALNGASVRAIAIAA